MEAAIQAAQAYLTAMGRQPGDEGYQEQFAQLVNEERKLAAEAEERKLAAEERKLEAEERKRADEAEERRLAREHEIRLSQQQTNATSAGGSEQRNPPPRIQVEILPFSPANERADRFIRRFELVLNREQVPLERFAEQLLKALPQLEAAPLLEVPIEEQFDYKVLKELFLRRHRVTETQLRDDFRNARPTKEDTTTTFLRTLGRTFDYWVEATRMDKSFESLRDRLIADHVTDLLPNHLMVLLREKQATTVAKITAELDAYFEARPTHSLQQACQLASKNQHSSKTQTNSKIGIGAPPRTTQVPGPNPDPSGSRPSTPSRPNSTPNQRPRVSPTATPTSGATGSNVPRPRRNLNQNATSPAGASTTNGSSPSPRGCAHHGPRAAHSSEACYILHPERRPAFPPAAERGPANWPQPTVAQSPPFLTNNTQSISELPGDAPTEAPHQEDMGHEEEPRHCMATFVATPGGTYPKGNLRTCHGTLNSKQVTVLLDTGSDSVFVARRLLKPTDFTDARVPVRTTAALISGCPVAEASFTCPYYPGGTNRVVVLDDPPFDVILGEVPGTIPFDKTLVPEGSPITTPKYSRQRHRLQKYPGQQNTRSKVWHKKTVWRHQASTPDLSAIRCRTKVASQGGWRQPNGTPTPKNELYRCPQRRAQSYHKTDLCATNVRTREAPQKGLYHCQQWRSRGQLYTNPQVPTYRYHSKNTFGGGTQKYGVHPTSRSAYYNVQFPNGHSSLATADSELCTPRRSKHLLGPAHQSESLQEQKISPDPRTICRAYCPE